MQQLSFKTRLKKLSFHRKVVLLGAFILILGSFLPWYADLDKFGIGDTFLGITGPMYLAGLVILSLSTISLSVIIMELFEKPVKWLPIREEHFYLFAAGFSLFMLILSNSVYFHPKFGVNLTDKSMGIGMMMSFGGVVIVCFGALIGLKKQRDRVIQGHMSHLDEISTTTKKTVPVEGTTIGKVSEDSIDNELNNVAESVAKIHTINPPITNQDNQNNGRGILDKAKESLQRERRSIQKPPEKSNQVNPIRQSVTKRELPPDEKIDRFQTIEERINEYNLKKSTNDIRGN
ncbi:hypothetical protein ACFL21_01255 [Patescibacteria group bacterium]